MPSPHQALSLSIWISPTSCIYINPREPDSEKSIAFSFAKDWLDVQAGDVIEVRGVPTTVLKVTLHGSRPWVKGFPEIVSGREWERAGMWLVEALRCERRNIEAGENLLS